MGLFNKAREDRLEELIDLAYSTKRELERELAVALGVSRVVDRTVRQKMEEED